MDVRLINKNMNLSEFNIILRRSTGLNCWSLKERILFRLYRFFMKLTIPSYKELASFPTRYSRRLISIYYSLTLQERENPNIIDSSRIKRISKGSGCTIKDVEEYFILWHTMNKFLYHHCSLKKN